MNFKATAKMLKLLETCFCEGLGSGTPSWVGVQRRVWNSNFSYSHHQCKWPLLWLAEFLLEVLENGLIAATRKAVGNLVVI